MFCPTSSQATHSLATRLPTAHLQSSPLTPPTLLPRHCRPPRAWVAACTSRHALCLRRCETRPKHSPQNYPLVRRPPSPLLPLLLPVAPLATVHGSLPTLPPPLLAPPASAAAGELPPPHRPATTCAPATLLAPPACACAAAPLPASGGAANPRRSGQLLPPCCPSSLLRSFSDQAKLTPVCAWTRAVARPAQATIPQ